MMYRTVTVTPTLSENITTTAEISQGIISIIPTLHEEIEVEPVLYDSFVDAVPTLYDNLVEVDAEWFEKIKVYEEPVEYYRGPYEFTPTQETQTANINGLMPTRDITINPIPSNYGLITWDGSVLTVS